MLIRRCTIKEMSQSSRKVLLLLAFCFLANAVSYGTRHYMMGFYVDFLDENALDKTIGKLFHGDDQIKITCKYFLSFTITIPILRVAVRLGGPHHGDNQSLPLSVPSGEYNKDIPYQTVLCSDCAEWRTHRYNGADRSASKKVSWW